MRSLHYLVLIQSQYMSGRNVNRYQAMWPAEALELRWRTGPQACAKVDHMIGQKEIKAILP